MLRLRLVLLRQLLRRSRVVPAHLATPTAMDQTHVSKSSAVLQLDQTTLSTWQTRAINGFAWSARQQETRQPPGRFLRSLVTAPQVLQMALLPRRCSIIRKASQLVQAALSTLPIQPTTEYVALRLTEP